MAHPHVPVRFSAEADALFEETQAFQRLPPAERWRVLFDLIASGAELMKHSPQRKIAEELRLAQEFEWQQAHRRVFARHGY